MTEEEAVNFRDRKNTLQRAVRDKEENRIRASTLAKASRKRKMKIQVLPIYCQNARTLSMKFHNSQKWEKKWALQLICPQRFIVK
jgi:hypothetical protein